MVAEALDVVGKHLRGGAIEPRVRIEPAFGVALLDWNLDVMDIAIEDEIAEAESVAGLAFELALKLPTAENRLGREVRFPRIGKTGERICHLASKQSMTGWSRTVEVER